MFCTPLLIFQFGLEYAKTIRAQQEERRRQEEQFLQELKDLQEVTPHTL